MGASIITGYTGTRHITPEMDGAVYRGIIGDDSYILAEGDQCEGTMPSVNQFTVKSGVVSIQGRQVYVTQETLSIDTCPTGYKRIDLICVRFEHDTTSLIDQASLVVIKGAEVSGGNDPVEPAHNEGVIKDGATVVDFVMYRLDLDGANVEITKVATVQSSLYMSKETQEKWNDIAGGASNDAIMDYLADEEWEPRVPFSSSDMSLHNCTGTIGGSITLKIRKDKKAVWATGRVAITNFARTGNNPGVKLANFSSLGLPIGLYIFVGIRGEAAFERAQIETTDGLLTTTESYQNASSGRLSFNCFNGIYFLE